MKKYLLLTFAIVLFCCVPINSKNLIIHKKNGEKLTFETKRVAKIEFANINSVNDDLKIINYNIFPNPNQGLMSIILDKPNSNDLKILIHNSLGILIYSKDLINHDYHNNISIDISKILKSEASSVILYVTLLRSNSRITKPVIIIN